MHDVRLRRSLVTRSSEREVINCLRRYFYLARDPFVGLRIPRSELSFYSHSQIGKCIACLRRRSDVAPSQSATLCARKSHPETIVPIETYRCPISGKVWFFDFLLSLPVLFVPAFPLHHAIFSVRFISDHRSSFIRSVMGVPLLFGREHARKKTGKKSSPLVFGLSLSLSSSILLFLFRLVQVFGLRSVSLSMQSPLPILWSNVPLRCFKDLSCLPIRQTNPRLTRFSFSSLEKLRRYKIQRQAVSAVT